MTIFAPNGYEWKWRKRVEIISDYSNPLNARGMQRKVSLRRRARKHASKRPNRTPKITALKRKLWVLCRDYIRTTYGNTCYTCGRAGLEGGNWQTGHFISSSICSVALRYDLRNLRPQCYNCNINKSGNWLAFEQRLTADNGIEYVESLKRDNEATKGLQYDSLWYTDAIDRLQAQLSQMHNPEARASLLD